MKHLGSSFVLSHFFSFSLCFCCDSCSDADVWTWSLIETWLSSSCPGCVTLISACPCFCCDDAYLGTVTGTRCDPWTASALYVWAAPLRFPQRVCPGRAARLFFCVVSMPSRGPSFEPVLRRSGLSLHLLRLRLCFLSRFLSLDLERDREWWRLELLGDLDDSML